MEQKNPVYVRMEYEESIESKKSLLSTEVSLLNLIKSLKTYHSVRLEEFKIKYEIYRAIKELNLTMRKTKSAFPFFKFPEKQKKENLTPREIIQKGRTDDNLELELQEIQERLRNLEK